MVDGTVTGFGKLSLIWEWCGGWQGLTLKVFWPVFHFFWHFLLKPVMFSNSSTTWNFILSVWNLSCVKTIELILWVALGSEHIWWSTAHSFLWTEAPLNNLTKFLVFFNVIRTVCFVIVQRVHVHSAWSSSKKMEFPFVSLSCSAQIRIILKGSIAFVFKVSFQLLNNCVINLLQRWIHMEQWSRYFLRHTNACSANCKWLSSGAGEKWLSRMSMWNGWWQISSEPFRLSFGRSCNAMTEQGRKLHSPPDSFLQQVAELSFCQHSQRSPLPCELTLWQRSCHLQSNACNPLSSHKWSSRCCSGLLHVLIKKAPFIRFVCLPESCAIFWSNPRGHRHSEIKQHNNVKHKGNLQTFSPLAEDALKPCNAQIKMTTSPSTLQNSGLQNDACTF